MNGLDRFVEAQRTSWAPALAELTAGRKTSHWMWFIFPQIAGLGRSPTARRYALADLDEARAYLAHPLLGARLATATEALLAHAGRPIAAILGEVDAVKLASSMTLFERVGDEGAPFAGCLMSFFGGKRDRLTLALIDRAPKSL